MTAQTGDNSTKWIIQEERVLDDARKARFSIAHVDYPMESTASSTSSVYPAANETSRRLT